MSSSRSRAWTFIARSSWRIGQCRTRASASVVERRPSAMPWTSALPRAVASTGPTDDRERRCAVERARGSSGDREPPPKTRIRGPVDSVADRQRLDDRGGRGRHRLDRGAHDGRRGSPPDPSSAASPDSRAMSAGARKRSSVASTSTLGVRAPRPRRARSSSRSASPHGRRHSSSSHQPATFAGTGRRPARPARCVKRRAAPRPSVSGSGCSRPTSSHVPADTNAAPVAALRPSDRRRGVVAADEVHRDAAPRADRRARRRRSRAAARRVDADRVEQLVATSARWRGRAARSCPRWCARRSTSPVRWCTSSSGSSRTCGARGELVAVVRGELEDRVERHELDPGRSRRAARAPIRSTTVAVARRCGRRGTRTAARRARRARRAGRSRRPRCRRRSTRPGRSPSARSRPRSHLGDEAVPVPAQRAVASRTGSCAYGGRPRARGGRRRGRRGRPGSSVAPKSTATTGRSRRRRQRPVATASCAALGDRRGAVAERPVRGERVERGAVAAARLGDERAHVGAERAVQHLGGAARGRWRPARRRSASRSTSSACASVSWIASVAWIRSSSGSFRLWRRVDHVARGRHRAAAVHRAARGRSGRAGTGGSSRR